MAVPLQSQVVIREANASDSAQWDAFVRASSQASFFHLFGWRDIFSSVFRLSPRYLIAERGGKICGILPLVHQKSILFGNALIAAPFCVEGGPIADNVDALTALDEAAIGLLHALGASSLEYRSQSASRSDWQVKKDVYATFKRSLDSDDEKNLLAIPRKQRAVIRKTLQGALQGNVDASIDAFYRVYSESMRNLGTPMFPKRYFQALSETFGTDCDIVVVRDDCQALSAVMNFYFRDTVLPY